MLIVDMHNNLIKGFLTFKIIALYIVCVTCVDVARDPASTIGLSLEYPADPEVKKLTEDVKDKVEVELGKPLDVYEAISYKVLKQQGSTYFVKVKIGENDYIHVQIISFRGPPYINGVLENKSLEDQIEFF